MKLGHVLKSVTDQKKHDKKSHIYKNCSKNSHPHVFLDNFEKFIGTVITV